MLTTRAIMAWAWIAVIRSPSFPGSTIPCIAAFSFRSKAAFSCS